MQTKLSSKGQVVLPKAVRDRLRWETGARLDVGVENDAVVIRRAPREVRRATMEEIDRVAGILEYAGPTKSIEEMDTAVDEMFRREWTK